jgi:hypothetical protein
MSVKGDMPEIGKVAIARIVCPVVVLLDPT